MIDRAIDVAEDAGVALSINLTGGVFVNQSAAFSDFHGTGANPAANAALTDAAFVASRSAWSASAARRRAVMAYAADRSILFSIDAGIAR